MDLKTPSPEEKARRQGEPAIVCYEVQSVPRRQDAFLQRWREGLELIDTVLVAPRDAACFNVPAGYGFRINCVEGSQVGDLNLWNSNNLTEHFFSGKTRQLHATHLTRGDRLWSTLPSMRAMATIVFDTLEWYGWDADGGGVHDVIGTRCDPYTNRLLKGVDYHHCCHSNLTRALAKELAIPLCEAEPYVHDVLNVFMCTGFSHDTHQYFMKASPARPGDYLEFMAEIDLLGALSSCPGGNCGSSHSDDKTPCYPLQIDLFKPSESVLTEFIESPVSDYQGDHGA
ncbi:MAG: DUF1989 domain-containing protein [Granulosicoccus sp.]|nr:DUF1989 domain-containing protein [Granulosicoccus sp.]